MAYPLAVSRPKSSILLRNCRRKFIELVRSDDSGIERAIRSEEPGLTRSRLTEYFVKGRSLGEARDWNSNEEEDGMKAYQRYAKARFAHPHYWAPFILIGNWK